MRIITVIAIALFTTGCTRTYVKPGATVYDFERDKAQCEYEAAAATANFSNPQQTYSLGQAAGAGFGSGLAEGMKKIELMDLCLKARGWTLTTSSPRTEFVQPPPIGACQRM
jgi:hypothetical protein